MTRWLGPLFFFLIAATGIGWLLSHSSEAREVAGSASMTLFGFFTTPFILETSVALLGLVAVLTYNQWRHQKEGRDEWVEMEVPTKPAVEDSEAK